MKSRLRWMPLTLLLLVLWLILNDSLASDQILLGAILALGLAMLAPKLRPLQARLSHPLTALRLAGHVLVDSMVSNFATARRILLGDRIQAKPAFLDIPLQLRDPHGLALLACIVTFVPGTVWAGHDPERGLLTLHVLDLQDAKALTLTIQHRYERPLREIFE